nr:hypothetical protein [Tanacetum cinerariifolium]
PVLSPAPPPSPIRSLGYRAAMIQLRAKAVSTSHSPSLPPPFILSPTRSDAPSSGTPLLLPISASTSSPPLQPPSASRREDKPEVTLPLRKRLGIALGPGYEVGESSYIAAARPAGGLRADYGFVATMNKKIMRDPKREVGYGITDSWDEIVETLQGAPVSTDTELGGYMREFETRVRQDTDEIYMRRAHAYTRHLMETEARLSREAWVRLTEVSDLVRALTMGALTAVTFGGKVFALGDGLQLMCLLGGKLGLVTAVLACLGLVTLVLRTTVVIGLTAMRIEQYFLMTDYSLWEVILKGDSPAPTRVIKGVLQPVAPTTAEQWLAKKNESKAHVEVHDVPLPYTGTFMPSKPDLETMTTVNQGMSVEEIERVVAQRVANAIEAIAIYETKTNLARKSMSQTERQEEEVAENASNKRKWGSNHDESLSQQNKGHKVPRAHTAWPISKKTYAGSLPLCDQCKSHHSGPYTVKCGNYKKVGHIIQNCRTPATAKNQRTRTFYECGSLGQYKSKCPIVKFHKRMDMIHRRMRASKPRTMQDAIETTTKLMNKKISTLVEC